LHDILGLSFCQSFFDIKNYQFFCEFFARYIISTGCADGACTYYGNFNRKLFKMFDDTLKRGKVREHPLIVN